MERIALIMAGGSGLRMGKDIPKQFIEINGKPVIFHTIDVFRRFDPSIKLVIVIPPNQKFTWDAICEKTGFKNDYLLGWGGTERFYSVRNGLDLIRKDGIVFIHDAIRPLVSHGTLERCQECVLKFGNAVPVIPVTESIRIKEGQVNRPVDRSGYFIVQTPQVFNIRMIQKAYEQAYRPGFTDDASVLESFGGFINLVPGNRENIKITFPEDLKLAEILLQKM